MVVALPVELECAGQIELGLEVFEPAPNAGAGAAVLRTHGSTGRVKKPTWACWREAGIGSVATRDASVAAVGNGAAGCGPGEQALFDRDPLRLGLGVMAGLCPSSAWPLTGLSGLLTRMVTSFACWPSASRTVPLAPWAAVLVCPAGMGDLALSGNGAAFWAVGHHHRKIWHRIGHQ